MKKRLLLILALTLIVVTVVASLTGCYAASASEVITYLKDSQVEALYAADATSALQGSTIAEQMPGWMSYLVVKDTNYYIGYVGEDGTFHLDTNVGAVADYTCDYYSGYTNYPVWVCQNSTNGTTYVYSALGEYIADTTNIANLTFKSVGDGTYFVYDTSVGDVYVLDMVTGSALPMTKATNGATVNAKEFDIDKFADADVVDLGEYYVATDMASGAVVYYDKDYNLIATAKLPTVIDSVHTFEVLSNGNIFVQGTNRLPEDSNKYDLLQSGVKRDVVTMMYWYGDAEWTTVKGYDETYVVGVAAITAENEKYQEIENLAMYYNIVDYKIDTSIGYYATMTGKGKIDVTLFDDETMTISNFEKYGDYLYLTVTDAMSNRYVKVYQGDELLNTVSVMTVDENLNNHFYITKSGVVKSYIDANFSLNAIESGYEYDTIQAQGMFVKNVDATTVKYAYFDTASKQLTEIDIPNAGLIVGMKWVKGYVIVSYNDGDVALYQENSHEVLGKGNYVTTYFDSDTSEGIVYEIDGSGKISSAYSVNIG